jgi:dolichol-phosphate mannosyltransferase
MDLSVVVPVKNEAGNIHPLIDEIVAALGDRLAYEIVYVNDGSTDATADELAAARRAVPVLRVLHHDRSCGQSRAVATGCVAARGRFIATLDGDGQNDPGGIAALWARLNAGGAPDEGLVVCGWRKARKDTGWRRFVSRVANGVRGALLGDRTPDSGCGLKIFARAAFLDLPRFDHMHRFLPALFLKQGKRVVSVEVNHRPRGRGTSKYGTWGRFAAGVVDLLGVLWLQRRSRRPTFITED